MRAAAVTQHACIRYITRHALDLAPGLVRIGTSDDGDGIYAPPPASAIRIARNRLESAAPTARCMRCATHTGMPYWWLGALGIYVVAEDVRGILRMVTVLPRNTTINGVRISLVTPDELDAMAAEGWLADAENNTGGDRAINKVPVAARGGA